VVVVVVVVVVELLLVAYDRRLDRVYQHSDSNRWMEFSWSNDIYSYFSTRRVFF
jgi:hypothetical protein